MAVESLKQVVTSLSTVSSGIYSAVKNKADAWTIVTLTGQALQQVITLTKLNGPSLVADLKTAALDPNAQAEILAAIQSAFQVADPQVASNVNTKAAAILPVAASAAELVLIALKKN